jgi:hypothetical protein
VTGFVVDRLTPDRQSGENDADQLTLAVHLDAFIRAQALVHPSVRAAVERDFSSDALVERLIAAVGPF